MSIVARGLGRGDQGAIVAFGLCRFVLPEQPSFGGYYFKPKAPIPEDQADELLLLIAAQIVIGSIH